MPALTNIIITGWQDDIKVVPCPLCPYWQHCETLTSEDGLVLHGEALVVPPLERERILQQLHLFHQGITKAQLLTFGCTFWPSINKAIEEVVHQCKTCTWFQAQNAATPSHPWQMCAMDIFTLEGADYLICGDFYSKMILIQCLPSGQSNNIKVCVDFSFCCNIWCSWFSLEQNCWFIEDKLSSTAVHFIRSEGPIGQLNISHCIP